jgi:hypothetical protein
MKELGIVLVLLGVLAISVISGSVRSAADPARAAAVDTSSSQEASSEDRREAVFGPEDEGGEGE